MGDRLNDVLAQVELGPDIAAIAQIEDAVGGAQREDAADEGLRAPEPGSFEGDAPAGIDLAKLRVASPSAP